MIPASLQAIKDNARVVATEAHSEAVAAVDRWWNMLISVATESLGEVWQYAVARRPPPISFDLRTDQVGIPVCVPGHRPIYASFHGRAPYPVMPGIEPRWWRARYSGSAIDVPDGVPYWFVPSTRPNCIGTYHQTLGSALNYAEEE